MLRCEGHSGRRGGNRNHEEDGLRKILLLVGLEVARRVLRRVLRV